MPMTRRTWLGAAAAALASGAIRARARSDSTPNIVGRIWTPDRDGSGKVRDSNWRNLPLNTWLLVGNQVPNDVIETPHLKGYGGYDGADATMNVWCGAAYDPVNKRLYYTGGGHFASSARDIGIYTWDFATCQFGRFLDRCPSDSLIRVWNKTTKKIVPESERDKDFPPSVGLAPDGGQFGGHRPYGSIPSHHSYWQIQYLSPEMMGNGKGGLWLALSMKNKLDLDTRKFDIPYWWENSLAKLYAYDNEFSSVHSVVDGKTVYVFHEQFYISTYVQNETQVTDWSIYIGAPHSNQRCYRRKFSHSIAWGSGDNATLLMMPEIRQCASLSALGHVRMRYGQAIDSGKTSWTPYTDPIALTSNDGSHLELAPANFKSATYSKFGACGCCYDAEADCAWLQPNNAGEELYRIDGIKSGNTWTTTKIAGTGALKSMKNGTYGRMRLATMGGRKILVRLSLIHDQAQVMRVS